MNMKELKIGNKVAKVPIVQGGMGIGISLAGLASAVANQGGIGVISAAGVGFFEKIKSHFFENNSAALKKQIREAREKTDGLIGVNIMVALSDFESLCKAAIEEKADFIFAGAGLPLRLPEYKTEGSETLLVPIVSSGRAASLITKHWLKKYQYLPDAFVIEGPKAGGHLGFSALELVDPRFALENLLPQVQEALLPFEQEYNKKIPLIVGGGIYTGGDIKKFLELGASGVQMATRFVTTYECDASDEFKQTYINATKEDITIIKSPVGLPGRAIKNDFIDQVNQDNKHPFTCPYHCISTCKKEQSPYCITLALVSAQRGKLKNGFAFAGSNAYLATKITSIKEVFQNLFREYEMA
ncbi:MAG: NAD(P)H-dependent flavin oxidoreductase [Candidatus Izemoplasmatales bacterium]